MVTNPYLRTILAAALFCALALPGGAELIPVVSGADTEDPGTLRFALGQALSNEEADVINIDAGLTITLLTRLSPFFGTTGVTIQGNGATLTSGAPAADIGLLVDGTNVSIRNLRVTGFPGIGVQLAGDNCSIRGCHIFGNGAQGILVNNTIGGGVKNCVIGSLSETGRNYIYSNGQLDSLHGHGIELDEVNTITIINNYIGVGTTGTDDLGNAGRGIYIDKSSSILIGNATDVMGRNVIGDNGGEGIYLTGSITTNITIVNNYIGVGADGFTAVPNNGGIGSAANGPSTVSIGIVGAGNVISGNLNNGIALDSVDNAILYGNVIGLDATGQFTIANSGSGVLIASGANNATVGGPEPGQGNVIAGNAGSSTFNAAVRVVSGSTGAVIQGNKIGVAIDGETAKANGSVGVLVQNSDVLVGGDGPGEGNIIANSVRSGVEVRDAATSSVTIRGNSIFGNQDPGILIEAGANGGIQPPVITGGNPVHGTTSTEGVVELFADMGLQGKVLLGQADALGGFFEIEADLSALSEYNLTATVTDSNGNTSQFSEAVAVVDLDLGQEGEGTGGGEGTPDGEGIGGGEGMQDGEQSTDGEGGGGGEGELPVGSLDCPIESYYSQPPDTTLAPAAYPSAALTETCFERITGYDGGILGVRWWGSFFDPEDGPCNPVGVPFVISFYDALGAGPTRLRETFDLVPTVSSTTDNVLGNQTYMFEVTFPKTVFLRGGLGWMQIYTNAGGCMFHWSNSQQGDNDSAFRTSVLEPVQKRPDDLAFCLIPDLDPVAGGPEGEPQDCPQAVLNEFTVTPAGDNLDWDIDGIRDPTLYLRRGEYYYFNVESVTDSFFIKYAAAPQDSNRYDAGVSNNGALSGTVYFQVPLLAPNTLAYQSSLHADMTGTLQICDPKGGTPQEDVLVRIDYIVTKLQRTAFFDLNRNGKLDLDEVRNYLERILEYFGLFPKGNDPASDLFDAMDLNGDGFITTGELRQLSPGPQPNHAADQDGDNQIGLAELLRVIQLYNSGGIGCAANGGATEDGYEIGAGDTACVPHSSDYTPQDWVIDLSELLRAIQFYNNGAYFACPENGEASEDTYCSGTPPVLVGANN
ncbi:MAG: hypothetical protein GC168_01025 [Candidatus Hydrogenedens sp.]|nr:hypothetical protein [Candidatus Hydrogenedens sp.]